MAPFTTSALCLLLLCTTPLHPARAQTTDIPTTRPIGPNGMIQTEQPPAGRPKVTLKLKNNGLLPREFKFVTRHPAEKYPNVFTAFLLPGAAYESAFREGTTIAQVTQAEINQTMNGQNVPGKPLLVVKADDNDKIINLIQP